MTVKRLGYFVELDNGTQRHISEEKYREILKEYEDLGWDRDEFSCNFLVTELFTQYDNCITFYMNDSSKTIGYCQREIH